MLWSLRLFGLSLESLPESTEPVREPLRTRLIELTLGTLSLSHIPSCKKVQSCNAFKFTSILSPTKCINWKKWIINRRQKNFTKEWIWIQQWIFFPKIWVNTGKNVLYTFLNFLTVVILKFCILIKHSNYFSLKNALSYYYYYFQHSKLNYVSFLLIIIIIKKKNRKKEKKFLSASKIFD